jgi:hypothetical protein
LADHVVVAGVSAGGEARYTVGASGAYLLYVIDPTGGHAPRLQGAPTGFTVSAGTLTAADAGSCRPEAASSGSSATRGLATRSAVPGP